MPRTMPTLNLTRRFWTAPGAVVKFQPWNSSPARNATSRRANRPAPVLGQGLLRPEAVLAAPSKADFTPRSVSRIHRRGNQVPERYFRRGFPYEVPFSRPPVHRVSCCADCGVRFASAPSAAVISLDFNGLARTVEAWFAPPSSALTSALSNHLAFAQRETKWLLLGSARPWAHQQKRNSSSWPAMAKTRRTRARGTGEVPPCPARDPGSALREEPTNSLDWAAEVINVSLYAHPHPFHTDTPTTWG